MNIIIVGGGPAAVEAALAIRTYDKLSNITIYTEENLLPYRRLMLIKALQDDLPPEKLLIHNAEFYNHHRINVVCNRQVIGIDWPENHIILNDFSYEKYDRLLLANGMVPRRLPIGSGNEQTLTLHNYRDLSILREILPWSKHIAVIGGGVLGCELAGALLHLNKQVTIIERGDELLTGVIDSQCGNFIRQILLEKENLKILVNSQVANIKKVAGEQLSCIFKTTSTAPIVADTVISAIGFIQQNILWQPAVKSDTLEIDSFMRIKGFENIYGAGDCVYFPGAASGSWHYAQLMGRIAGSNIARGNCEMLHCKMPEIRSSFMGIKLYAAGDTSGTDAKNVICCDQKKLKKLFYRNKQLIGFVLINQTDSGAELYRELCKSGDQFD